MTGSSLKAIPLLVLAFALFVFVPPVQADDRPSILLLNSYHNGYKWSDNILAGIRESFAKNGLNYQLYIEYLDSKRGDQPGVSDSFYQMMLKKYGPGKFDVVITSDNRAFDFVIQHLEDLFPDVPIVFSGVNGIDAATLEGLPVTGIVESAGIRETLDLAFRLHPETRRLVVVGDDTVTGRAIRRQVEEAAAPFTDKIDFDYWYSLPLDSILEQLQILPDDALVFFIPSFYTFKGHFYEPGEVVKMVSEASPRPVYSSWTFLLGWGIVGGRMANGLMNGEAAASLVLRILKGEPAGAIPIGSVTNNPFQFDHLQMKRFGITRNLLPPSSTIINSPQSFYKISKDILWTMGVSFALVTLMLLVVSMHFVHRKRLGMKMLNQLSFQELLLNTIPQLICWKDTRQRYLGANRGFAAFFGHEDPAELINKTDYNVMKEGRYTEWALATERDVLDANEPKLRQRINVSNVSGEQIWLEINTVPLHDASGEVVGTLTTAEDVTREINLERQLLQSQKMEAIGALAGGVAHDFNNILTSVINSTELALTDVEDVSDTADDLKRVLKASKRGKLLVEQIMAFSRPSQEGFRNTNLADLVRDTLTLLSSSLPRNISIESDIRTDNAPQVHADPTQIYQVLINLCTNAFQAMRDSGGILEVSLEEVVLVRTQADILNLQEKAYYRLIVADNGPGVHPDINDKIFDPFFTTKGKTEGTGLGLSVVLGIVKNHKGAVHVVSEPGHGASFEVYFPAHSGDGSDDDAPRTSGPAQGQGRILFVEDDQDQLEVIPRVLQSMGYEVEAVPGAEQAMQLLQKDHYFDLIITDYDMPKVNGLVLASFAARLRPDLPVILVSGRSKVMTATKPAGNICQVLPKPFTKTDLSEAIRNVLR